MMLFTPPRLGRGHLLFGAVMVAVGAVLIFDLFSSLEAPPPGSIPWQQVVPGAESIAGPATPPGPSRWFFQNSSIN
jgi:hypothetical protein